MSRTIIVSNETTVLTDAIAQAGVAATQKQIDQDFAPAYSNLRADLQFWPKSKGTPPTGKEIVHILDNSDQAGALGYHELNPAGYPEGFVFAQTTMAASLPWQTTLSHETLEQLLDPFAQWTTQVGSGRSTIWVILEDCDPCEADSYQIDGIPLSNFVLPAWFQQGSKGPWDKMGKLQQSLSIDSGGYVAYADSRGNWHQYTGQASRHAGPTAYSRHGRYQLHAHRAERGIGHPAAINWTGIQGILSGILNVAPTVLQIIQQISGALPGGSGVLTGA